MLITIGTILLNLPSASSTAKSIGFIHALFTATSDTCVTGLIVLDTGRDFSIFWAMGYPDSLAQIKL